MSEPAELGPKQASRSKCQLTEAWDKLKAMLHISTGKNSDPGGLCILIRKTLKKKMEWTTEDF